MKNLLLLLVISVGLLNACASYTALSTFEKNKEELTKDAQEFFQSMEAENGVHLFKDEKKHSFFVFLNGYNVQQGDFASHFSEFEVKSDENTLHLSFKTDTTPDYSAEIKNQLYYEVKLDRDYDVIRLYNNDEETNFGTISAN